jgi:putative intracellular protease/amidase
MVCSIFERPSKKEGVDVLFLMPRTIGANNFLLRDVIEEYGWNVTRTSVGDAVMPCVFWGRYAESLPLLPDISISEVSNLTDYDLLVIPSAPGNTWAVPNSYIDILKSTEALNLISTAVNQELPVFAMCAGVRVLAAADVIKGKRVVGSPRFREEYEKAGATYAGNDNNDTSPCIDGNIITGARGQTYNQSFGYAFSTVLEREGETGLKPLSSNHITALNADFGEDAEWAKTYGGTSSDGGRGLCKTADDGYLLTGYTFNPGQNDADVLAIKTDGEGNIVWSRAFGGAGTEYGNDCASVEGGYLLTGYTSSFGAGGKDVLLIKIDENGHEIWTKTYGGKSWDVGMSVCESRDGNYYVCGFTHSFSDGEEDVYLLKIDKQGNEIWSKSYGGERIEMGGYVSSTDDNGCIFAASTLTYGGKNSDFWLVRVNEDGNEAWKKAYGANPKPGHGFDWCKDAILTKDGGVVAVGYSDTNDLMDAVVVKVDSRGDKTWLKTLGDQPFYQYGNGIVETSDGSFIMVGTTKSMRDFSKKNETVYNNNIYIVKLGADGNIAWQKTIGGYKSDWANSVVVGNDGDLIILGHTNSNGMGSFDVCLLKVAVSN